MELGRMGLGRDGGGMEVGAGLAKEAKEDDSETERNQSESQGEIDCEGRRLLEAVRRVEAAADEALVHGHGSDDSQRAVGISNPRAAPMLLGSRAEAAVGVGRKAEAKR